MIMTSYINDLYWRKCCEEASKFYKEKMMQLGTMEELRGSFHGVDAPNHMMYKLDTLYSKDGHRAYEFLIEYNVYDPNVGIYYGCKGLTLKGFDHAKEIEVFKAEWNQIKGLLATILNNTFPGKNFGMRFKATDNANDDTFWPFWITLNEEEDIHEVGLRALRLIRNTYKRLIEGEAVEPKDIPIVKYNPDETSFTQKAYKRLLDKLSIYKKTHKGRDLDKEKTAENIKLFETFMSNAENGRLFYKYENTQYELAWQFQCSNNSDFIRLMTAFFQYMANRKMIRTKGGTNVANVPWKELSGVILSANGTPFSESLRTQKDDALRMPPNEMKNWQKLISDLVK